MLRYEMRFAEGACKEFCVQVNWVSQIGPNLLKPILLHGTSFAHFVGSVSVVDSDPRLGCASPAVRQLRWLASGSSFASFAGSIRFRPVNPRLGCASPGAITLSASFAGSTSGSTPDSPSSVGCDVSTTLKSIRHSANLELFAKVVQRNRLSGLEFDLDFMTRN